MPNTIQGISRISNIYIMRFGLDEDANNFITAASITGTTEIKAINQLVIDAKTNNWWNKCYAIYPFVGSSLTAFKWNLKDPRDLDVAYRLTFVNSPTANTTGIDYSYGGGGSQQYANTYINGSTKMVAGDAHLSVYSRENTSSGWAYPMDMGVRAGGPTYEGWMLTASFYPQSSNASYQGGGNSTEFTQTGTESKGFYLGNTISTTSHTIYKNGVSGGTSTEASLPLINGNIFLGAINSGGSSGFYCERNHAFVSIGTKLTSTEITNMYDNVQNFQTTLERQV